VIAEVEPVRTMLTAETLIPLGVATAFTITFVGGVWKFANMMNGFAHRLDLFEERMGNRLAALEAKKDSHVTWSQLRAVLAALHVANPTMKPIDVDAIKNES